MLTSRFEAALDIGWESGSCCLIAKLCLTLCNSMDCSLPGPSVHGLLEEKEYWVGGGLNSFLHHSFLILIQLHYPGFVVFTWKERVVCLIYLTPSWTSIMFWKFIFWIYTLYQTVIAERGTASRAQEWTLVWHSEMNCPRRHMCWQSKRLYWEGVPCGEQEDKGTREDCSAMWLRVPAFLVMG